MMSKTTFGYQLKACGSNRHAARYAGIADKRNIVIFHGDRGRTERGGRFALLSLRQHRVLLVHVPVAPCHRLQRHPCCDARLLPNPIGIIFTALFLSMLDISGLQLTNLTAYNEYITNVIIAVIVYLSAFSLVIKMWIGKLGKKKDDGADANAEPAPAAASAPAGAQAETEKGGDAK